MTSNPSLRKKFINGLEKYDITYEDIINENWHYYGSKL